MGTAEDYAKMSDSEKKKEDWMNSKWRPMMGWLYMATCTFDFVIFPILWSLFQGTKSLPVTQWQPLTLQGAGLYHIAMGAVLGLAAFGRTQEKLAGANNGGLSPISGNSSSIYSSASPRYYDTKLHDNDGRNSFRSTSSYSNTASRPAENLYTPAAAMGGLAVGAAVGMQTVYSNEQFAQNKFTPPRPSRHPYEDDHPELD